MIEKHLYGLQNPTPTISKMHRILKSIYSECMDNLIKADQDKILKVYNVNGFATCVGYQRMPLHAIKCTFSLSYHDDLGKVESKSGTFSIKEEFYYHHDGYEGEHDVEIYSDLNSFVLEGFAYGTEASVIWGENELELEALGLGKRFQFHEFIQCLIEGLLEKLPIIDPLYGKGVLDSDSLKTYMIGSISKEV